MKQAIEARKYGRQIYGHQGYTMNQTTDEHPHLSQLLIEVLEQVLLTYLCLHIVDARDIVDEQDFINIVKQSIHRDRNSFQRQIVETIPAEYRNEHELNVLLRTTDIDIEAVLKTVFLKKRRQIQSYLQQKCHNSSSASNNRFLNRQIAANMDNTTGAACNDQILLNTQHGFNMSADDSGSSSQKTIIYMLIIEFKEIYPSNEQIAKIARKIPQSDFIFFGTYLTNMTYDELDQYRPKDKHDHRCLGLIQNWRDNCSMSRAAREDKMHLALCNIKLSALAERVLGNTCWYNDRTQQFNEGLYPPNPMIAHIASELSPDYYQKFSTSLTDCELHEIDSLRSDLEGKQERYIYILQLWKGNSGSLSREDRRKHLKTALTIVKRTDVIRTANLDENSTNADLPDAQEYPSQSIISDIADAIAPEGFISIATRLGLTSSQAESLAKSTGTKTKNDIIRLFEYWKLTTHQTTAQRKAAVKEIIPQNCRKFEKIMEVEHTAETSKADNENEARENPKRNHKRLTTAPSSGIRNNDERITVCSRAVIEQRRSLPLPRKIPMRLNSEELKDNAHKDEPMHKKTPDRITPASINLKKEEGKSNYDEPKFEIFNDKSIEGKELRMKGKQSAAYTECRAQIRQPSSSNSETELKSVENQNPIPELIVVTAVHQMASQADKSGNTIIIDEYVNPGGGSDNPDYNLSINRGGDNVVPMGKSDNYSEKYTSSENIVSADNTNATSDSCADMNSGILHMVHIACDDNLLYEASNLATNNSTSSNGTADKNAACGSGLDTVTANTNADSCSGIDKVPVTANADCGSGLDTVPVIKDAIADCGSCIDKVPADANADCGSSLDTVPVTANKTEDCESGLDSVQGTAVANADCGSGIETVTPDANADTVAKSESASKYIDSAIVADIEDNSNNDNKHSEDNINCDAEHSEDNRNLDAEHSEDIINRDDEHSEDNSNPDDERSAGNNYRYNERSEDNKNCDYEHSEDNNNRADEHSEEKRNPDHKHSEDNINSTDERSNDNSNRDDEPSEDNTNCDNERSAGNNNRDNEPSEDNSNSDNEPCKQNGNHDNNNLAVFDSSEDEYYSACED